VTREWFLVLSREIFNQDYALFNKSVNSLTYMPNPFSHLNHNHVGYFQFVGRIIGKALYDGQLIDAYFTRSFYKHMLGLEVNYHDLEAVDADYYKNLVWMLENDITGILDLTFSSEDDELGRTEIYDLKPDGRNVAVTEENKFEYVDLIAKHKLTTAIDMQKRAFLEGFRELIPANLVSIFTENELELLMCGLPEIDMEDLRANTEYTGYQESSVVAQWFWRAAMSLSREDKARLLMFITGTSKVPLEGFKALQGMNGPQKFNIHKAYGIQDRLPSAHTCFNQLDLPEYDSYERLRKQLLFAIREGSEGFGFG